MRKVAGAGVLAAVVVALLALLPKIGSWFGGPGDGEGEGSESGKDKEPDVVGPAPALECHFRVDRGDQIFHGAKPLTFDEFMVEARKCHDEDKVVHIEFVPRGETAGFRKQLLEALDHEGIARTLHELK